jgi:hypothetical protein
MAKYHCHYLEDGQSRSQIVVDAPDDGTILLEAEQLLASSQFFVMEVWQGERLVGRVIVGTPAELSEKRRPL